MLHIIRYKTEIFLYMNEVIRKFIGEDMSILQIRRRLAKGHAVSLLSLDAENNADLRLELIRYS